MKVAEAFIDNFHSPERQYHPQERDLPEEIRDISLGVYDYVGYILRLTPNASPEVGDNIIPIKVNLTRVARNMIIKRTNSLSEKIKLRTLVLTKSGKYQISYIDAEGLYIEN